MTVIEELIRKEANGLLSFGNYTLDSKSKVTDFEHEGDLYKVKTFKEITKLEKNGLFVYESVPGTSVMNFKQTEDTVDFHVSGNEDAQVILELEAEKEYRILIDSNDKGTYKTNLGGKLAFSLAFEGNKQSKVSIVKI